MKVLLSIGCDEYQDESLLNLGGAENDAQLIYNHLVEDSQSLYDSGVSILLKSPTFSEVKDALSEIIFDYTEDLEICLYFAGHGCVKDGSYFFLVKDSRMDRLSISAVSIAELFLFINEAKVKDTAIIIDACNSGGVGKDIVSFIKPENSGDFGTPSISIMLASARNQLAEEGASNGIFTTALAECLKGTTLVQSESEYLTLGEIFPIVANMVSDSSLEQNPAYWALNLFGKPIFSRNPNFTSLEATPFIPKGLISDKSVELILRDSLPKIWSTYLDSRDLFVVEDYLNLVESLISDIPDADSLPLVCESILSIFNQNISKDEVTFELVEIYAATITVLLPRLTQNQFVCDYTEDLVKRLHSTIRSSFLELSKTLDIDENFLLSRGSLHANLFYLPIRITRLLGWLSFSSYIASYLGSDIKFESDMSKNIVSRILDSYTHLVVAVSEQQAPFLLMFFNQAATIGVAEEAETIFGLVSNSIVNIEGCITRAHISGRDAYRYVKGLSEGIDTISDFSARPMELISVLFASSVFLGLEDVVDEYIETFDRKTANIFLPSRMVSFSDELIEEGVNVTYSIGNDVWSMSDFSNFWDENIEDKLDYDDIKSVPLMRISGICAAFMRPDRSPWYICKK